MGVDLRGASLHLAGGCDAAHHRQCICTAGLKPHLKENPRHRKPPQRGRTRLFHAAMQALRRRVERTFAWEDPCKRLLLRFERLQQRQDGMQVLAYTLINPRKCCGTSNSQPVISKTYTRFVHFYATFRLVPSQSSIDG